MKKVLIATLLFFLLTGCNSTLDSDHYTGWLYQDLKTIEPANAVQPSADIIATYARHNSNSIDLRIDFLEQEYILPDYDIFIAFNTKKGGKRNLPNQQNTEFDWDFLLSIPHNSQIELVDDKGNPIPNGAVSVYRNPTYDFIEISLSENLFSDTLFNIPINLHLEFQVFTTEPDSKSVIDATKKINLNQKPPLPSQVLMAFWDTFPAYTPALTLRRWDGAHTGPHGSRHGLKNLLRVAKSIQVPVLMLDLTNSYSLSELDYANYLDYIKDLQQQGIIYLSDSLPNSAFSPFSLSANMIDKWIQSEDTIQKSFLLPQNSSSLFSPSGLIPSGNQYNLAFTLASNNSDEHNYQPSSVYKKLNTITVPLHFRSLTDSESVATPSGPSITFKKSLIYFAIENNQVSPHINQNQFFAIGGSLPMSTWGEPQSARATLKYFKNHPWIKVITPVDISHFKPNSNVNNKLPNFIEERPRTNNINDALISAPDNQITLIAWQMVKSMFNPVYPYSENLPVLRANYIGQIRELLTASYWAAKPVQISDCSKDIDQDNLPECILASENIFLIIEPDTGSITFAFNIEKESNKIHQILGPSSQLIIGLSDPSFWNLSQRITADPTVIPGAFYNQNTDYIIEQQTSKIILTFPNNQLKKTFQISPSGFEVTIDSQITKPEPQKIPVIIDPWQQFTKDWANYYEFNKIGKSVIFTIGQSISLTIFSENDLIVDSFMDTKNHFQKPENPNLDYPPGHNIPYPVILITIPETHNLRTTFTISH